jgi:hypothetical protein
VDGGAFATGGAGGAGGAGDSWAEGEFRVCVTETAYTRARVYRYDTLNDSCVTLLFEAPSDACRPGFPVSGAWCLASASVAQGVEDCGAGNAEQAESASGAFTVSSGLVLEATLTLEFAAGGSSPLELAVAVAGCRLNGCDESDCRD